MKKTFLSSALSALMFCAGLTLFSTGCTAPAQRTAYNTIFTVEQTATLAVDDYFSLVIKGTLSTNGVPTVASAFDSLQSAGRLAATASELGTNALAPSGLIIEAANLGNLITTIEQSTKK